jgi:hypothetical protein
MERLDQPPRVVEAQVRQLADTPYGADGLSAGQKILYLGLACVVQE